MYSRCSETEAIDALKEWNLSGLPRMPAPVEILQLVADAREKRQVQEIGCSKECQRRHFTSYGENDLRFLLKRRMQDPGVTWTDEQWNALLDECDQKRTSGAPAWRKESGSLFA